MSADTPAVNSAVRPVPRWVAPLFAVLGVVAIPWTVYLGLSLPQRHVEQHHDLSWVGFDALLVVALLSTAVVAWRARSHVELPAFATATLLVVDAWFDTTTSQVGVPLLVSVADAVLVELPLAALCVWIALHADLVRQSRQQQLARRPPRRRRRPAGTQG